MKFTEINLHPAVLAGVEATGFADCTPIQEVAIPVILSGRDLAGLAQTGTGKTAAFVLPLMDRIVRSREAESRTKLGEGSTENAIEGAFEPGTDAKTVSDVAGRGAPTLAAEVLPLAPEAAEKSSAYGDDDLPLSGRPVFKNWRRTNFVLVLVPTRELAEQVYENVTKLGKEAQITATAIYGGTGYEGQKAAIKRGVDFIVATPGRLIDLYKEHLLDLNQVRAIVFDEADRMFDMGFKDDMKFILRRVPRDRQFLVFSATLNFDVLNTAYEFGANPTEVNVSRDQAKADNVVDEILHVGNFDKPKFILSILQKHKPSQVIVFSNFKHNVERIAKFLSSNGVPAMGISSLISQSQRTRIMELFRAENNDRNILVATDVAARGLDIKGVDMVINYELPDDAENYVHRIGRTGRAGAKGVAFSLVGDRDVEALQRIETYLGHKVNIGWIDDADLVKDFKEFPRGEREDRPPRPDFRRDGGGSGGRGPRREDRGPRDGQRDSQRGGGRDFDRGPRRDDRGPRGGDRQDRPHDRDRGPRGGEPRQGSGGSPQGPRHPSRPHQGSRPQQGGGSQGGRPHSQQGRGPQPPRDRQNGPQASGHNPNHRHRQGFKHKPGSSPSKPTPPQQNQKGVMSKVSGFFKKLFGG